MHLPKAVISINYFSDPLRWDRRLNGLKTQPFADRWAEINETLKLTSIQALRARRIFDLVRHAYANVPLYKERYDALGIAIEDIREEKHLSYLPSVSKKDFKAHAITGGDVAKNIDPIRRKSGVTSGSTGEPFHYFTDQAYSTAKLAMRARMWRWSKADIFAPKILCCQESALFLNPNQIFFHPHFLRTRKHEYIECIRMSRAHVIFGQPLGAFDLLWMLAEEAIHDVRFHTALLGGHAVSVGIRNFFKSQYDCEIFEFYGAGEMGYVAQECENHNGLHIQEENVIIEIVDSQNRQVPDGVVGNILLTSLCNDVMPFIRYDIGDVGVILKGSCPCGREARRILVEGRTTEYFFLGPNGESVPPSVLRDTLDRYFHYFHRYQMIQIGITHFKLNIVATGHYCEEIKRKILSELRKNFAGPVTIEVSKVGEIPSLPSGKFQYFVSSLWQKRFPKNILLVPSLGKRAGMITN